MPFVDGKTRRPRFRNLFARQAIAMVWDFGEAAAFAEQAGDYGITLGTMLRVLRSLPRTQPGQVQVADAAASPLPDDAASVWFTDPPYYDAIPYADTMGTDRAIWQVSGGPSSRSFADLFLRSGVALIGPGDAGPWASERDDSEYEGSFVRRFASELQDGDIVLLRTGSSKVRAVELAASDYLYLSQFDDVNGWDLQHGLRVRWKELPAEYDFGAPVFGASPSRFSKVHSDEVADYAHRFVASPPAHWQTAPLPDLPLEEPALEDGRQGQRRVVGGASLNHEEDDGR